MADVCRWENDPLLFFTDNSNVLVHLSPNPTIIWKGWSGEEGRTRYACGRRLERPQLNLHTSQPSPTARALVDHLVRPLVRHLTSQFGADFIPYYLPSKSNDEQGLPCQREGNTVPLGLDAMDILANHYALLPRDETQGWGMFR